MVRDNSSKNFLNIFLNGIEGFSDWFDDGIEVRECDESAFILFYFLLDVVQLRLHDSVGNTGKEEGAGKTDND